MRTACLALPLLAAACGGHLQRRPDPPDVDLRSPAPTMESRRSRPGPPPNMEPLAHLDDDDDGVIDDRELGRDVERTFAVLDRDGDETIDRAELVLIVADDADAALEHWDTDGDGAIQPQELSGSETTQSQSWEHRYSVPAEEHPGH